MFTIVEKELFRWRRVRKNGREMSICTKLLVIGQIVFSSISLAVAAPTGGAITSGTGNITQAGTATNINQASQRLDINWRTFSTASNESINFFQPNATALAINRVIGGVPSELRGALNANGRVFVLNESGITFYGTSQVNVGALLATTAKDVTETPEGVFNFSGNGYGQVINQGNITVSPGGFAVLAAPYVENTGMITANLGTIQLASANNYTVDLRGDGLINFTVTKEDIGAIKEQQLGVDNSGSLTARSGIIGISANLAAGIVQGVVNLNGVVDATALNNSHVNGGTVLVESVGEINTGKPISGNQEQQIVGAEVHADGAEGGNGGTIQIIAGGANHVYSGTTLTARGGSNGGNGGLIEVSGPSVLYRGDADASAVNGGTAGTLRIDPEYITIANGDGTDGSATIYEKNIERTSQNGTNVELIANDRITMQALTDDGILAGGSGNITMQAGGGNCTFCTIKFDDKSNQITTTATTSDHAGSISMTAFDGGEGGKIDIGSLHTTGRDGSITLISGSRGINARDLSTGGTGLGISQPGEIWLSTTNGGDITAGNISIVAEGNGTGGATATLDIETGGSLNTGSIFVKAVGDSSGGGFNAEAHATLNAGGDITVTDNITVKAQADVTNFDSAYASAGLTVNAGQDLNITGNTLVSATASQPGPGYGYGDAHAYATATLDADKDITIIGNIDVNASALNKVPSAGVAYAQAKLNMDAGGVLSITGNHILVNADATRTAGYGGGYGSAYASASADAILNAGSNVIINSSITVQAAAANNGGSVYYGYGDAYADAHANLNVTAGQDLSIAGNVLVDADATRTGMMGYGGNYGPAHAYAKAYLEAIGEEVGGNVTLGGVTVQANSLNTFEPYNYGSAEAYLTVRAGNDLVINGNTLVTANTKLTGNGNSSAYAYASADLHAGHNMTLNGNVTVQAVALNEDDRASSASAYAYLTLHAKNDLSITGNILVKADATQQGAHGSSEARATASADLWAGHDLTVNGRIDVLANAVNNVSSDASSARAYAYLTARAENDLTIKGDILVKADATMGPAGASSAYAYASADLSAGRHVTILTDPVTVSATALNLGHENDASAYAHLNVRAGDGGEGATGDLYITGDVVATATASGGNYNNGSATVDLSAPGNLTVLYATAPPKAYAPNPDDPAHALVQVPAHQAENFYAEDTSGDGETGSFYASVNINAGGKVTIEPKPVSSGCGRDECEVNNALEARRVDPIEPLPTGRDPLRIAQDGLVLWATGAGVTLPSTGAIVTADMQSAIAAGADPSTLLPATAAGGKGLAAGLDAFSIGGTDYCDQVVSGFCLPAAGGKANQ